LILAFKGNISLKGVLNQLLTALITGLKTLNLELPLKIFVLKNHNILNYILSKLLSPFRLQMSEYIKTNNHISTCTANYERLKKILNKFDKIKLIASGGLSDIDQIRGLKKIGCFGVIIGKAIYEKSIDLKTLSNFAND
jgi:hypothetical protein